ncbi:MAG: ABC transporter permease [Geminicoccaceae bacterium]
MTSGTALYGRLLWRRNAELVPLYVLLLVLLAVYAWLYPGLLSISGIARFTQNWFPVAVVAMAQTLVMLTGGIDLAVGAMVSLGSVLAASWVGETAFGATLGIAGTVAVGAAFGACVGAIVALLRLPAIIVTLASSFIIGGVALLVMPKPGGSMPAWLSDALAGTEPLALLLLAVLLVAWRLLLATPLGLAIQAAGDNPVAAFRSGVPVGLARIVTYGLAGGLAALAGVYVAAQTGAGDPVIGNPLTLQSITAAVLGGVGFLGGQGTLRGAVCGSLLLAVMINVMFHLGFPPVTQYVAQGLVIVAAMAVRRFREA